MKIGMLASNDEFMTMFEDLSENFTPLYMHILHLVMSMDMNCTDSIHFEFPSISTRFKISTLRSTRLAWN